MHAALPTQRRITWCLGAILVALAISLAAASISQAEPPTPNSCSGTITGGEKEAGSEGTAVRYKFSCDGPITGYQIQSRAQFVGLQSAPLVANEKGKPLTETFSCGGEVPGFALNCVGAANAANDQISGQFYIGPKLCATPRVEPLLTVTYAYVEKEVTQYISGPYALGTPKGCPAGSHKAKHGKSGKRGKKGKGKKK